MYKKPYLFIENGEGIRISSVVGVFDLDFVTRAEATNACLKRAQDSLLLVNAANDLPKSLILTEEAYGDRLYFSGLSSDTVIKRIETDNR